VTMRFLTETTVGERRKLLSAGCSDYIDGVGRCVRLGALEPHLGSSARSQGGPRWVSVVSGAHDQGPQPVPRYLDRLNGRDTGRPEQDGEVVDAHLAARLRGRQHPVGNQKIRAAPLIVGTPALSIVDRGCRRPHAFAPAPLRFARRRPFREPSRPRPSVPTGRRAGATGRAFIGWRLR
jgi:hypothetical protein